MAANAQKNSLEAQDKPLNVKGLSRKERKWLITKSFVAYGPSLTYQEKIKSLAARLNMKPNAVLLMGKRWHWNEEEIKAQASASPSETTIAPSSLTVVAPAAQERPFSTTEFVAELKLFTRRAVECSSRFAAVTARLIELYATRIEHKIETTPNPDNYELSELDWLYGRLSFYMNKAKAFTSPGGVASLLNSIRFGERLPPDAEGVDHNAFTVAQLQKYYAEANGGPSLLQDPEKAEKVFAQYEALMPVIHATRADAETPT